LRTNQLFNTPAKKGCNVNVKKLDRNLFKTMRLPLVRPLLTGSAHRAKSGDLATAGPAAAGALPLQQRFNAAMAATCSSSGATASSKIPVQPSSHTRGPRLRKVL
jgi:hypothetical protein